MDESKGQVSRVALIGGKFSSSSILHLTLGLQICGIFLPYVTNLMRIGFNPPLPFISQAVGCIPENGLFTSLMVPASFIGLILSFLIHTHIKTVKKLKSPLHIASSCCCIIYFLSWILISAYPFSYTDVQNKKEWVNFVLWEHMVGALLMLGSCVFFPIFQTAITWDMENQNKKTRIMTLVFVLLVAVIGLFSLLILAFEEVIAAGELSVQDISYQFPVKFTFYYIITSICEWILVFSMWISLGVFYEELKGDTFSICVLRKEL